MGYDSCLESSTWGLIHVWNQVYGVLFMSGIKHMGFDSCLESSIWGLIHVWNQAYGV